jgi:hypothetical protein
VGYQSVEAYLKAPVPRKPPPARLPLEAAAKSKGATPEQAAKVALARRAKFSSVPGHVRLVLTSSRFPFAAGSPPMTSLSGLWRRASFRQWLDGVVQERLEFVRELYVVDDDVVVASLADGALEARPPQAKPVMKGPSELVIADYVTGRRKFRCGIGREADLVCPGFRLGFGAKPQNAQRAFSVIHQAPPFGFGVPPCRGAVKW